MKLSSFLRSSLLALSCTFFAGMYSPVTLAQQPAAATNNAAASAVVLNTSTRILGALETRRAEFRGNPAVLKQFMLSEFNQSFDRDYAARMILGVHSRGASDADVKEFADAMTNNLMEKYGVALLNFNSKLDVKVKNQTDLPGGRGVKVSTEMLRGGATAVPVDYLLRQVNGQWKVFDVIVEGISYVQTFRTQFDAPLRQKSILQVAADLRGGNLQINPDAIIKK